MIIMCDLDADMLRPLVQPAAKALLDSQTRHTTSAPTRVTHATASCTDIISVNKDIEINRSEVIITSECNSFDAVPCISRIGTQFTSVQFIH